MIPQILHTKIVPPGLSARILARPRITRALLEARHHRLTLLQAGTGYGKSTALAALAGNDLPLVWYQITEEDSDPLVFLLHLNHATRLVFPTLEGLPLPLLESWEGTRGPLPSAEVAHQYLNSLAAGLPSPTLLVIDDVHLVAETPEIAHLLDRLISLAPPDLHIILAARPRLNLPNLARWRARDEVLTLDQRTLAFTPGEVGALFAHHYGYELTPDEAEMLCTATEGWAITLPLIWQGLRSGASLSIEDALTRPPASLESLFELLATEVVGQQPEDVQAFLVLSSTLRELTPPACDALRGAPGSAAMLAYLRRQELFVVDQGSTDQAPRLRYQRIFRQFLQQRANPAQRQAWHSRAAAYFQAGEDFDSAIYHLLQATDHAGAAALLASYGANLITMGRLDTLAAHLDALPPETFRRYPELLSYQGDLARLHSRFPEALGWYQQAEALWRERGLLDGVGRALRGQARVYLDTVNPRRAEELLQQALHISDGSADREAHARLYELLAENKLNSGKPDEAERLRQQAAALRREGPDESQLLFRVLLRTGRLDEARQKLEAQAETERQAPVQTPRAHRETQLLLSLIYAFQGRAAEAYQAALAGTRRGVALDSPFVEAVGHMRQGHALMLLPEPGRYAQARAQFEQAVELSRTLATPRLRVEAYWGLCRTYGYQQELQKAEQVAREGLEIATQAGDEWIASLIRLAMGGSLTLAARYEIAATWLDQAARGFSECADSFGEAAARLWRCLAWHREANQTRLAQSLPETLAACREANYDFLFLRPTLLGPPDERVLVPLLIEAARQGWESAYAGRLLRGLGLPQIALHPGYQLKVFTLGTFEVWRGDQLIPVPGWRREKTRQLFQLLLTFRSTSLDREQIFEHLWPDADLEAAKRNFKVALNTLYQVLEPDRTRGADSAYVAREGTVYRLRPEADVRLDALAFAETLREAEALLGENPAEATPRLEQAVGLYHGEYLPEARYEPWAAAEREHLKMLFLRAADHLCEAYLRASRFEGVVELSHRILAQDNCWERAYRYLIQAHHALGDRGQAARAYHRCVQTLREELDVAPAPETETLAEFYAISLAPNPHLR